MQQKTLDDFLPEKSELEQIVDADFSAWQNFKKKDDHSELFENLHSALYNLVVDKDFLEKKDFNLLYEGVRRSFAKALNYDEQGNPVQIASSLEDSESITGKKYEFSKINSYLIMAAYVLACEKCWVSKNETLFNYAVKKLRKKFTDFDSPIYQPGEKRNPKYGDKGY